MKLKTTVGALLDAFAITSPTLDKKGPSSALYLNASDKTGKLYLYSTNLRSETLTKVNISDNGIEEAGEILINPSKLADGLSSLPKTTPVTMVSTPTGNALKVQAGNVKFSLAANVAVSDLSNRARAIPLKTDPIATIPTAELEEFCSRSEFCIPNDQTGQRANLAALRICSKSDKEEAVATDGSIAVRIASVKKQGKGDGIGETGLQLPATSLPVLKSLAAKRKGESVSIIVNENKSKVFFKFSDGTYFGSQVMVTKYPNMDFVFDAAPTYYADVPRESFKQSLVRANSFVTSTSSKKVLELEFDGTKMSLRANGDEPLSDEISITYKGEQPPAAVKMAMNIDYLASIAAGSKSENLTFGFSKDDQPLIMIDRTGEDDDQINIKYVVMGIRQK